jgi:hypothetical protein
MRSGRIGSSFLSPAKLILLVAGLKGGERIQRGDVLRLIQIRLTAPSLEKFQHSVKKKM